MSEVVARHTLPGWFWLMPVAYIGMVTTYVQRWFDLSWWEAIRRDTIVAVHGDVPHRPTWSSRIVVETTEGTFTVPAFEKPGFVELMQRLQEWSGRGEPEPAAPPLSGDSDDADRAG